MVTVGRRASWPDGEDLLGALTWPALLPNVYSLPKGRLVTAARAVALVMIALVLAIAFTDAKAHAHGARRAETAEEVEQEKIAEAESESEGEGRFGRSVALSSDGDTALVGAPGAGAGGTASVFTRSGTTWTQLGSKLLGGEASAGANFGASVALSGDGETALVGAPQDEGGHGSVWVFTRSGAGFTQQGVKLTSGEAVNGHFGSSVAISGDGDTALIGGARGRDGAGASAWVFTRTGSTWTQQGEPLTVAAESVSGHIPARVALSEDGDTALLGALIGEGKKASAWVFTRAGEGFSEQAGPLTGVGESVSTHVGSSFALSGDGDTALIGAARDEGLKGGAWIFTRAGASWSEAGELDGGETGSTSRFGYATALSSDGDTALVGAPAYGTERNYLGTSWVFARGAQSWTRSEDGLLGEEEVNRGDFGESVALSGDGRTALIGAPRYGLRAGAAWVFSGVGPPVRLEEAPEEATPKGETTAGETTSGEPSAGGSSGAAASGVLASEAHALALPLLGRTANLRPISGHVLVKLPGSSVFVPLQEARQVPFGTIIDATHGRVALTTARLHGGTQTMTFYSGRFQIRQQRDGLVVATLLGGSFARCPTRAERHPRAITSVKHYSRKHVVRTLWAEGHGSYSTKGNYASGAVLGTRWLTEDRCDGTLIFVATDRVRVTNLLTHRRLNVRAGHSYLAKAR